MKSLFHTTALAIPLLLLIGCDKGPRLVPVKGVATRGGKPIAHLSITFFPSDDSRASIARTDEKGQFEMSFARAAKGVTVGKHKVAVTFRARNPTEEAELAVGGKVAFHPDQDAILEKYGTRETTALAVEITKKEDDLQLKLD